MDASRTEGQEREPRGISRRGMFTAALGGAAGWLGAAILRAVPAQAADGGNMLLGNPNTAASQTSLTRTGALISSDNALRVDAGSEGSAIRAVAVNGNGVVGGATGVGTGVRGEGATGVTGEAIGASASKGVYGICPSDSSGYGVIGQHADSGTPGTAYGTGVYGESYSPNGWGVSGRSDAGTAVQGQTDTGYGGNFIATDWTNGVGLRVSGPVKFSTSGIATIKNGARKVTVTPGIDITKATKILATLHSDPGGTTTVQYVSRDTAADHFTIWVTDLVDSDTKVAWFAIS